MKVFQEAEKREDKFFNSHWDMIDIFFPKARNVHVFKLEAYELKFFKSQREVNRYSSKFRNIQNFQEFSPKSENKEYE